MRTRSDARPGLAFPAKFQARASWSRIPAAFPLSERHAGPEQVSPSLLSTIDRVFSKLSRLFKHSFLVILDRLQRYPDLVGHLGAQISFTKSFCFRDTSVTSDQSQVVHPIGL
jgi:hypothetical protein